MAFKFIKRIFSKRKERKNDDSDKTMKKTFSDLDIRVGSSVTFDTSNFLVYQTSLDQSKILSTETVDYVLEYELFGLKVNRFMFKSKNFLQICKLEDGSNEAMFFTESMSELPSNWDDWIGDEGILRLSELEDNDGNLYKRAWDQDSVEFTANMTTSTYEKQSSYDTMLFYRNVPSIDDSGDLTDELLLAEIHEKTRAYMYIGLEVDYINIKVL